MQTMISWRRNSVRPAVLQVVNRLVPDDKKYHAHLTIECEDKNVMEFEFNGTGARFDRKCFAMITRLNCGKFPRDSELEHLPYDLWTKFFGKRGPMTWRIDKAFEDLDFDENEVADNVKCCMFYFLETVLLGGDKKRYGVLKPFPLPPIGPWQISWEVDAALYYIRRRSINSPQVYDQRAIVTDCMFWSSIHARYTKYLKEQSEHGEEDELSDTADWEKEMKDSPFDMYALGTLPIGSKSWLEVDYVYVPVNNNNKHWLAAKVDIRNRTITLYDPNNAMSQDEFQCRNAKCLSILFPYLLMVHGYYDLYPELKVEGNSNLEPFDIKRELATNVPQQKVSGDCGIYIIKYIEYMVAKRQFDFYNTNAIFFREKLAVDIFHDR
ncbi:hypothetical protein FNV43_RR12929 [Rhamnella rubrinervis]|uniref:Ubiquitin-like protease family profile domain-containing protein n=1 Tax=Rhamnella rubrinervis TaxID=2594499 RepID=A0A8K0H051_9ROSA|nr:hypothetical protein FNV43_RR12929 [Rhamnella rubrinervis]